MDTLNRCASPKPVRGEADLERKSRRADVIAAEQAVMQAALKRDGRKCRWPGCTGKHRGLALAIDPAHLIHRGSGGNSRLDRTTLATVIALCRRHHGLFDGCRVDIQPLTDAGADGPMAYFVRDEETGMFQHVISESVRGVS